MYGLFPKPPNFRKKKARVNINIMMADGRWQFFRKQGN